MSRVLVTGGAGFVGTHLADALVEAGHEVRLLDLHPPSSGRAFVRADVRDAAAVLRAADGCDVIVDNAALVPVTRSSAAEYRSVNVGGCRSCIAAARATGAYLVHVSSSAVYGLPRSLPVTEDAPFAPFEPYGVAKAEAERLVQREREAGLVVAALRPRALMGRARLGVFEPIFTRVRAGRPVPLFGRGDRPQQMGDARDFAAAVLACMERRANGDYNVAAAEFSSPRTDLQGLIDRVGSSSRLVPVPIPLIRAVLQPLALVGRSPFTAWHWQSAGAAFHMTLDKAARELGWRPRHSNVDALEYAYRQFQAPAAGASAHLSPLRGGLARVLRG